MQLGVDGRLLASRMRMWMTTFSRVEGEVWKRQGPMQLGVHEPLIASGKRK